MISNQRGFIIPPFAAALIPGKDLLIKIAVGAVILAFFGLWCYTKGAAKEQRKHLEFIAKQAVTSAKLFEKRTEVLREVEIRYRDRDRVIVKQGATIEKEVPIYVTKTDDARCDVNAGFVRSFNAAVANDPNTATPSERDREPSGVPLSAVAETSAFNITLGHRWKQKALTCIESYEAVRAAKPE